VHMRFHYLQVYRGIHRARYEPLLIPLHIVFTGTIDAGIMLLKLAAGYVSYEKYRFNEETLARRPSANPFFWLLQLDR